MSRKQKINNLLEGLKTIDKLEGYKICGASVISDDKGVKMVFTPKKEVKRTLRKGFKTNIDLKTSNTVGEISKDWDDFEDELRRDLKLKITQLKNTHKILEDPNTNRNIKSISSDIEITIKVDGKELQPQQTNIDGVKDFNITFETKNEPVKKIKTKEIGV